MSHLQKLTTKCLLLTRGNEWLANFWVVGFLVIDLYRIIAYLKNHWDNNVIISDFKTVKYKQDIIRNFIIFYNNDVTMTIIKLVNLAL